jgi:hypothetical protein
MKIAVHRFQVWDSVSDAMKKSSRPTAARCGEYQRP